MGSLFQSTAPPFTLFSAEALQAGILVDTFNKTPWFLTAGSGHKQEGWHRWRGRNINKKWNAQVLILFLKKFSFPVESWCVTWNSWSLLALPRAPTHKHIRNRQWHTPNTWNQLDSSAGYFGELRARLQQPLQADSRFLCLVFCCFCVTSVCFHRLKPWPAGWKPNTPYCWGFNAGDAAQDSNGKNMFFQDCMSY